MFKLDTVAMAGATLVMAAIFTILKRKQFKTSPTDSWGGFWAAVVQEGLLRLHKRSTDPQNFRVNAIVFGGDPLERRHLIQFAHELVQNRGLCTYFYLLEGDVRTETEHARRLEPATRDVIGHIAPDMFARVTVSPNIYDGILNVSQSYGLSGMTPNTVLMGWGEETERPAEFTDLIRGLLALDHNLLLLENDEQRFFGNRQTIDIWWGGLERNGELMILLAFLLTSSEEWSDARVRINVAVDDETARHAARKKLQDVIASSRVRAEPNVIVRDPAQTIQQLITETSREADLVLLGLREPAEGEGGQYIDHVTGFIGELGSVLLVRASSRFEGAALLFDE
jgi:hypothetical protein